MGKLKEQERGVLYDTTLDILGSPDILDQTLNEYPPDVHDTLIAGAKDLFPYYKSGDMNEGIRRVIAGVIPCIANDVLTGASCPIESIPPNEYTQWDENGGIIYMKPITILNGNDKKP